MLIVLVQLKFFGLVNCRGVSFRWIWLSPWFGTAWFDYASVWTGPWKMTAFKWSTDQAFMLGETFKPTLPCLDNTTWNSIEASVCCSIVRVIDLDDLGFLNKGPESSSSGRGMFPGWSYWTDQASLILKVSTVMIKLRFSCANWSTVQIAEGLAISLFGTFVTFQCRGISPMV